MASVSKGRGARQCTSHDLALPCSRSEGEHTKACVYLCVCVCIRVCVCVCPQQVLLILALIAMLFGYSLYQELDVETEMSRGSLPGALALTAKIGPAVQKVLSRTWDALKVSCVCVCVWVCGWGGGGGCVAARARTSAGQQSANQALPQKHMLELLATCLL